MIRFLIALTALAAPLAAAELNPARIPASAKWLIHTDIDAIRASESGKAAYKFIEREHGDRLRALQRMFSLHLADDLAGITLHGDGKKDHAVAIINGTFDREHLEDIVKGADAYSSAAHGDFTIHTWTDKGHVQHAAFAADDLLVFSRQRPLLEESLDVIRGAAPATEDPLHTAPAGTHMIAAARMDGLDMPHDAARILQKAASLRISTQETEGMVSVRVSGETREAADADRLLRFLDGVIAFGQLVNPEIAELNLAAEAKADGNHFSASLSMPADQWISIMEAEAAKRK